MHSRLPRGVRPRLEGRPRTPLSSRVATQARSFIVSGLTLRSLIHFEFIFVYGVRKWSSFILLQVVDQFSQQRGDKDDTL